MSLFILIDAAALSRHADLPGNPLQEAVPTTMIETLVRLFTSLFH
ncbi:hypothetical protein AWB76_02150 [Caballeronia temeraria]|uniref:Uncharacterized protein n=1 Tax=Caballeronia temeraria TaxID=1777137 RepID=A0A158AE12_9BURK|nr:hypothetical protein [Caballeronia temeraria]SAK55307.1 hypothetical protein AWB76_02150 [Caballeronia temeraria]